MKSKILFVLCVLVGLLFINGGLNKFFNYIPTPSDLPEDSMNMFMAIMQIGWLMPLIALAELIGGVLFIIPRFRALGAVILCPVLVGILLSHLTIAPEGLPMVLPMAAVWLWVVIENRRKYLPMITTQKAM